MILRKGDLALSFSRIRPNEKGNVAIILALALMALAGMAAISVDAGLIYANRIRLSNALDSAVLAGVHDLPQDPARALQQANAYAQMNGITADQVEFHVAADGKSITGTANRQMELYFARVLGFNTQNIQAQSQASVTPVSGYTGIVPFGVDDQDYSFGQNVTLKVGASGDHFCGWFGALSLGGNGACTYRTNIKNGCQEEVRVGDVITVEPGNMAGPTSQGIQTRLDACNHCPQCTIDHYVEGCPRIIIVPLGYSNGCPGRNGRFTVTGFAAFLISNNNEDGSVNGSFIRYVVPGTDTGDCSEVNDNGLYQAALTQ